MRSAKPCLGHPTTLRAVAALMDQGLDQAQITARINTAHPDHTTRDSVRTMMCYIRNGRRRDAQPRLTLTLSQETSLRLSDAAQTRRTTVDRLSRALLDILSREPTLIDNLLDGDTP